MKIKNIDYSFNSGIGYGRHDSGLTFLFDEEDYPRVRDRGWYPVMNSGRYYFIDSKGHKLHSLLLDVPKGFEVDHIDLNTLDNRKKNLRICTHQQNQINQPLQKNNTSGFTGVRYYPARKKYVARLKLNKKDIHLGYYATLIEAVQARNVGMKLLFGSYGRYNDVPKPPISIYQKVFDICFQYSDLSHGDLSIFA